MKNRVPLKPNRKKIVFEDTGETRYATLEYADQPVTEGTPLNKATLLSDQTAAFLQLSQADPTVDDALRAVANQVPNNYCQLNIKTQDAQGNPVGNVQINGINDSEIAANHRITDANGRLQLLVTQDSYTLAAVGYEYVDSGFGSTQVTCQPGQTVEVTMVAEYIQEAAITASTNIKFSKSVASVDVFCVGGGGAGGGSRTPAEFDSPAYNYLVGGGGGGGYTTTQLQVAVTADTQYAAVVGSGGAGKQAADGYDGGKTSVLGVVANGGNGGLIMGGGGSGGSGGGGGEAFSSNGGSGGVNGGHGTGVYSNKGGTGQGTTTRPFGESSRSALAGGGQGGSSTMGRSGNNGAANTGGGGGGVSIDTNSINSRETGANGASGIIMLRFHRK